jgi:predicted CoA-binding protein
VKIEAMGADMDNEKDILKSCQTIAVVGLSGDENKTSHRVAKYLQEQGYKIIPVNPNESEILGETCYPNLAEVPEKVDVVDIFRKSEDVPPVVDDAIKVKAGAIWMQEGIVNEVAAKKAREAGIKVVMDKCMLKEHLLLKNE